MSTADLVLAIMLMVHLVQIFYTNSGRKDPSYHRVVYPVILIQVNLYTL